MFKYMYMVKGQGQTIVRLCHINIIIVSIWSFVASYFPLNDFKQFPPCRRPILHCREIGQGQLRVMIYINFVDSKFPKLHAKF